MAKQNHGIATKLAMTAASALAGVIGTKLVNGAWGVVFGEQAPTSKVQKDNDKALKEEMKRAKKQGASKQEIRAMESSYDALPVWKISLYTVLSGAVIAALQLAAQRGAERGADRLAHRRPPMNRG
ncbi:MULTISPECIES: DUF4235 domain-containing protein [Helcobacillus]|uniref:DUF4235 domain-containing protein n=1 Tax=Helcobacillus massiliensis TaxID=521392 RepID=A0A839R2T3_9MICO|nr:MULTISPECIES: DUF4235 domain-containing protein [Helcobacillus]MBB3023426.1 hypothetical protein [Helcobacillus massiliensis]MCG7427399.1 DUF4235 domain-containing protein [Helcobacillus sp. ACRRO]MDK7743101.1 DUF4235 domain-containing protein [Helcobacillus massiliensis]WOO93227.1 DUF4235 domain-containing protein [Helcobacillus massiliensis]